MTEPHHEHTRRDAETQVVLGIFMAVLAVFVLIGTIWADTTAALVVNVMAGTALLIIGLAFVLYGKRGFKRLPK